MLRLPGKAGKPAILAPGRKKQAFTAIFLVKAALSRRAV
jgi:hypothetical protein